MNICNIRHIRTYAIFFPVLLMLVCVAAPACSSRLSPSSSGLLPSEIPLPDAPRETVMINGETYDIPPPWTGNRYIDPKLDFSDFRRIPVEYTHEGSKIYILGKAQQPLVDLLKAAEKDGVLLKVESAYRSEGYQKRIFKRMLAEGRSFEDIIRYVAPPGYSEHMLGTAVDFFPSNWNFADTAAYTWLRENGQRFGFEETYSRFNPMKMPWESWHWNFTGHAKGYQSASGLPPTGIQQKRAEGRQK